MGRESRTDVENIIREENYVINHMHLAYPFNIFS
jgi:hypothetical protein